MRRGLAFRSFIAIAIGLSSVGAMAAGRDVEEREAAGKPSDLNQKRQAVQGVAADAQAILTALQRDPHLASRLAENPAEAKALLSARGAIHAEQITVTPGGGGAARTITITIVIDHVTITITIKL